MFRLDDSIGAVQLDRPDPDRALQSGATFGSLLRERQRQNQADAVMRGNAGAPPEQLVKAFQQAGLVDEARAAEQHAGQVASQRAQYWHHMSQLDEATRKKEHEEDSQLATIIYGAQNPQDWEQRKAFALQRGLPKQKVDGMGDFDPGRAELLKNIVIPPEKQADDARASAQLAETVRHNKASESMPRITTTGTGQRFQFNPQTNQYDIPVGDAKPPGSSGADDERLTPEAIEQTASAYVTNPSIGSLRSLSKRDRAAVLNRAAQIGGDLAGNGAQYKANVASLSKLQAQADSIETFEQTAFKNVDTFLEQAKKIQDSGSPLFNMRARDFASHVMGDPDMAALEASRQTAYGEVSKVLSGQTGGGGVSDSARHEAEKLFSPDATIAQWFEAASILKKDMLNRKRAVEEGLNAINERNASLIKKGKGGGGSARKAGGGNFSLDDAPSIGPNEIVMVDPKGVRHAVDMSEVQDALDHKWKKVP